MNVVKSQFNTRSNLYQITLVNKQEMRDVWGRLSEREENGIEKVGLRFTVQLIKKKTEF